MSTTKDKTVYAKGRNVSVKAEIYSNANEVVVDCQHRPLRFNDYQVRVKPDWSGVRTYDEALDLLKNGYQASVETFKDELKVAHKENKRISFQNDIQGFAPIVPLALKGVPNCMIDMRMKPIKAKVLDVYYDMGVASYVTPREMERAGQALLGTVLNLERQGYKFNLYAVQSFTATKRSEFVDFLCVKVKSSNSPLDLKRMSFPLTHPAFFRVIGFDWQGKSPITRYNGSGRGYVLRHEFTEKERKEIVQSVFGTNAFYIACSDIIDSDYDREELKGVFTNAPSKR